MRGQGQMQAHQIGAIVIIDDEFMEKNILYYLASAFSYIERMIDANVELKVQIKGDLIQNSLHSSIAIARTYVLMS